MEPESKVVIEALKVIENFILQVKAEAYEKGFKEGKEEGRLAAMNEVRQWW
jgi:flagellar biosynthesis/type III secretory pathway protein FliH